MTTENKIMRPRDGRMIAGVCAAVARRFEIDVTWVRLGWVLAVVLLGVGILIYLILWIVIPEESASS